MKTAYFCRSVPKVKFSPIKLILLLDQSAVQSVIPMLEKCKKRVPWRPFFKKLTTYLSWNINLSHSYQYETKKIENDSYHFLFPRLCPSLSPALYFSFDAVCHPTQVGFIQDIAKCCYLQKRIHWGKICHYLRIFRLWVLISKIFVANKQKKTQRSRFSDESTVAVAS